MTTPTLASLRPRTQNDRRQLLSIAIYLLVIVAAVAALLEIKNAHQNETARTWQSASAVVEDTRAIAVGTVESSRGGAMLYDVQVFVKYTFNGASHERWIKVQQRPEQLADAQLQEFRWKGKTYLVRWNPTNPDQVIAEVS